MPYIFLTIFKAWSNIRYQVLHIKYLGELMKAIEQGVMEGSPQAL